jgi:hypothetical protein
MNTNGEGGGNGFAGTSFSSNKILRNVQLL